MMAILDVQAKLENWALFNLKFERVYKTSEVLFTICVLSIKTYNKFLRFVVNFNTQNKVVFFK